jgi:hypothetical protein
MADLFKNRKLQFWGYMLTNGVVCIRRYFDDPGDLAEAAESDFVEYVVQPFESSSRDSAIKEVEAECMKYLKSLK